MEKLLKVFSQQKIEKNHPMVPPLDHFQGKNKSNHLLPERSVHQDDHFLQTWPLLSGTLD